MTKAPSLTKWQIIRRFQSELRRLSSEGLITPAQQVALAVLPEFLGDDDALFPSHQAISDKSGVCVRVVGSAMRRAAELGIVKQTPRYVYDRELGKRVRTSNAYEIVLSAIKQMAQAARYLMGRVRDHLTARHAEEHPLKPLLRPERVFQPPQMSRSDMMEWCLKVAKTT